MACSIGHFQHVTLLWINGGSFVAGNTKESRVKEVLKLYFCMEFCPAVSQKLSEQKNNVFKFCLCLFRVFFLFFKQFHEISGVVSPIFFEVLIMNYYLTMSSAEVHTRVCSKVLICDDACEFLCFSKRRKIYAKHSKPLNVNCSESPLCFGTQIEVVTITRMSQQVSKTVCNNIWVDNLAGLLS